MEARNVGIAHSDKHPVIIAGGNKDWFLLDNATGFDADGFCDIVFANSKTALSELIESAQPDIILLHDGMNIFWNGILEFMSILRKRNYRKTIVVATNDPSIEDLMYVLSSGVDDYFYLGPNFDLSAEMMRLLSNQRPSFHSSWDPDAIARMGFFRSLGLTAQEITILVEYARDFPRRQELAKRLGKSEIYLRKCFSQIYTKLKGLLAVDNQAQLAHLLTICCLRSRSA